MAAVKREKKRKKYFKLKRSRVWGSLIMFCLFLPLSILLVMVLTDLFVQSTIYSRATSEYNHMTSVAELYDDPAERDTALHILEREGWTYLIRDNSGEIVAQQGENTCSDEGHMVVFDFGASDDEDQYVHAWADTEKPVIIPNADHDVQVRYLELFRTNKDTFYGTESREPILNEREEGQRISDEEAEIATEVMGMPIWLGVPVENGELIFKVEILTRLTDMALMALALGALSLFFLVMFIVLIISAISSARSQGRIKKLFFKDMATEGHNWMWYLLTGEQMLRRRKWARTRFAAVDLTFINYRSFCLCHSMEEGEQVLTRQYETISRALNKKELCGRYGDGSFALLLKVPDESQLEQRLKDLIDSLTQADQAHRFAFQAGVYIIDPIENPSKVFPKREDVDLERDFNNASSARLTLEGSEDSGIAFFDDKLLEEQRWRDTVQERQQAALDNEEFIVYYQPKYDPRTEELRGAEALIRWQSPEFGFVTPYRFIPIFEKNGFITEIDHYMISHVARDQRRWLDQGLKCVPVSVNVSRAHFIESDLAEQIRDLVDAEGAPHDCIEIELTESAFFDDKKAMIDTITRLKSYGFTVSMDDFGSGYSSLNSLKDMPLDVLKLDAEFFRGEEADTQRAGIVVSEAIKLAKSLHMKTVAEGVEVKEQVDFLAEQECDMIQGYYFAKPMPGEEYAGRLAEVRG